MKNNGTKRNKIAKVLFGLSFLPIAALIAVSIYALFAGGGNAGLDLETFNAAFVYRGLGMCAIPVLPAAIIYQIIYLIKTRNANRE